MADLTTEGLVEAVARAQWEEMDAAFPWENVSCDLRADYIRGARAALAAVAKAAGLAPDGWDFAAVTVETARADKWGRRQGAAAAALLRALAGAADG